MADPEKERNLIEYRETRINQIVANSRDPEWRSRHFTFLISGDDETQRRHALPVLVPFSDVGVDCEGRIYIPRWVEVDHIEEGAIIFGPTQRGRDYAKNPPKTKRYRQLRYDHVLAGVDVALRRSETIRDKYRLEHPQPDNPLGDNKEAEQLIKGLELVAQLRRRAMNLSKISEQDLLELARQNAEYLTEYGLINPKSADKKRIREMLLKGFEDRTGRVNPLAAFARTFSIEVNWRKRLENAFPNILNKYANNAEMLRFERDKARWMLNQSIDELRAIVDNPQFSEARSRYKELSLVSRVLTQVRVKPYLLGAYVAVIQFGTRRLPEGTLMRKIQERRMARGVLSVADLLRVGDFDKARDKLIFNINYLQKILDLHADYQTVKASAERKKRLAQTTPNSDE